MARSGRVLATVAVALVALVGTVGGRWYYTAALEPVDPEQGVYGMSGLEVWIELNARMPAVARSWGCDTLRAREREVLGGRNSLPPYSCAADFGEAQDLTAYQTAVEANLAQAAEGLDAAQADALRACFETRMASSVTPEEIAAVNAYDQTVMSKVIVAVSESVRSCKASLSG